MGWILVKGEITNDARNPVRVGCVSETPVFYIIIEPVLGSLGVVPWCLLL